MYHIVYETTNLINGKKYRGVHQTTNLNDGYLGSGLLLVGAIKKYGLESFSRKIIKYCASVSEMYNFEMEFVDEKWVSRMDTYNIKIGGSGGWNFVNENSLNIHSGRVGKRHSEETKEKIRKKAIGRKHTSRTKEKISVAISNRIGPNLGRKLSKEWKQKIGEASKRQSKESRKKVADKNRGRTHTMEAKLKISRGHMKRVEISGIIYESYNDAAMKLGVCRVTIRNMVKRGDANVC
jgi:group I intron endonuclease